MSLKKRRNDEIVERNMKLVKLSLNVVRKINVSLKLLTRVPSKISKELAAKKEKKNIYAGLIFHAMKKERKKGGRRRRRKRRIVGARGEVIREINFVGAGILSRYLQ